MGATGFLSCEGPFSKGRIRLQRRQSIKSVTRWFEDDLVYGLYLLSEEFGVGHTMRSSMFFSSGDVAPFLPFLPFHSIVHLSLSCSMFLHSSEAGSMLPSLVRVMRLAVACACQTYIRYRSYRTDNSEVNHFSVRRQGVVRSAVCAAIARWVIGNLAHFLRIRFTTMRRVRSSMNASSLPSGEIAASTVADSDNASSSTMVAF